MPQSTKTSIGRARQASALVFIDRALGRVETIMLVITTVALLLIMSIVTLDALLRYTMNRPLGFTAEIVTLYLISAVIFPILSYTLRQGGHINVDLFAEMMPLRPRQLLAGLTLLLSAVFVAVMTYEVGASTWEAWSTNERYGGIYSWPTWLSKFIVAGGLFLFELRLIHIGATNVLAAITGNAAIAIRPVAPDEAAEEPV